jgi:hypothetical protein
MEDENVLLSVTEVTLFAEMVLLVWQQAEKQFFGWAGPRSLDGSDDWGGLGEGEDCL